MRKFPTPRLIVVALATSVAACGPTREDLPDDVPSDIEVLGEWDEEFAEEPTLITRTKWGTSTIASFDNDGNWAVVQAPASDAWNPNKFSKIVWTEISNGAFFYCWVDFGLDTEAEAKASTKTADATNPSETGCGGEFPWTKMVPAVERIEVRGEWDEEFAIEPTLITPTMWGASTIASFDNDANWAVVQAPASDEWNPNKFSKLVWTEISQGAFFYCWVDFGLDTAAEAEASTKTADATNPSETGCGGEFAWTKMTARSTDG